MSQVLFTPGRTPAAGEGFHNRVGGRGGESHRHQSGRCCSAAAGPAEQREPGGHRDGQLGMIRRIGQDAQSAVKW